MRWLILLPLLLSCTCTRSITDPWETRDHAVYGITELQSPDTLLSLKASYETMAACADRPFTEEGFEVIQFFTADSIVRPNSSGIVGLHEAGRIFVVTRNRPQWAVDRTMRHEMLHHIEWWAEAPFTHPEINPLMCSCNKQYC